MAASHVRGYNANGFRYRWQSEHSHSRWFLNRTEATAELAKYQADNPGAEATAELIRERRHDGEVMSVNYGR